MHALSRLALLALALGLAAPAAAQYPNRPVRIVVPATAGDGSDVLARTLARALGESLGQQFVIENRPGAGGSIAADTVAKAAGDGYTLFLGNGSSHGVTPGLYPRLPYDSVADFAPVGLISTAANVLIVGAGVPAASFADFARLARETPGRVSIASAGNGSLSHLSVELLRSMARLELLHVPYKGAAPGVADVAGGQVQAMIINIPTVMPLIKAGKLRALAATSARRAAALPEVPTLAESGVAGYETLAWFGLLAPARTPPETVTLLHRELQKALARPEVRDTVVRLGAEASGIGPAEFLSFIKSEIAKYGKVIRDAGIKVE
ncbi:MAG: tripartite tricarboxylate transporter substrate binding protein [Burkholderiales bacterium]|nr:tripartite tricarboxylate transporter substrate binding protein [Burkholderiales bacterium]